MLVTILGSGNQLGNLRTTNTLKDELKPLQRKACCQYVLINLMKILKLGL